MLLFTGAILQGFSQQYSAEDFDTVVVRDLNLWNKIAVKTEIVKNLDAEASFGLRLKDDASLTDQYFGNLNLDYKLNKHFDFALQYRYSKDYDEKDGFEGYNRFGGFAAYRKKIDRLTLKFRTGFTYKTPFDEENDKSWNWRNKLSAKYNLKGTKLTPLFSSEIFYHSESDEINNYFSKVRFTLGASYNKKKIGKFNVFYRLEQELNENFPTTDYVIGLGYTYTFKTKKKEETK